MEPEDCRDDTDNFADDAEMRSIDRITRNQAMMSGKACIRGMRVSVGMVVGQIAGGSTVNQLLKEFPCLQAEDITQVLRYAALIVSERVVTLPQQYKGKMLHQPSEGT